MSKFLVLWCIESARDRADLVKAIFAMPAYAEKLKRDGKLEKRYHIVGKHGGAWIYDVSSNEELDRLLAMAPVYNFAKYEVIALAEMIDPATIVVPNSAAE